MWADVRAYIQEAPTCIEAAMAAGEAVAAHDIVPSRDFEKVLEQLNLAVEALDKVRLPDDRNVVPFSRPGRA
jgi:hypothetical protein